MAKVIEAKKPVTGTVKVKFLKDFNPALYEAKRENGVLDLVKVNKERSDRAKDLEPMYKKGHKCKLKANYAGILARLGYLDVVDSEGDAVDLKATAKNEKDEVIKK